jgi:hypothetical protein
VRWGWTWAGVKPKSTGFIRIRLCEVGLVIIWAGVKPKWAGFTIIRAL